MLHLSAFESAGASEFYTAAKVSSWTSGLNQGMDLPGITPGEVGAVKRAVEDAWSGGMYKEASVTETLRVGRYSGVLSVELDIGLHAATKGQSGLSAIPSGNIGEQLDYYIREVEEELARQPIGQGLPHAAGPDEHRRVLDTLKSIRKRHLAGRALPPPNVLEIKLDHDYQKLRDFHGVNSVKGLVRDPRFKVFQADDDYFMAKLSRDEGQSRPFRLFRCDGTRGVARLIADHT